MSDMALLTNRWTY